MWLLLGCVLDIDLVKQPGEPGDLDTAEPDEPDVEPCSEPAAQMVPLPVEADGVSAHNVLLAPDLDGGGLPDLLYPSHVDGVGLALVRGEDLARGDTEPTALLPGTLDPAWPGHSVGLTGDLDDDGLPDVLVGDGEGGGIGLLVAWSPASPDAPIATITFGPMMENGGWVHASPTPGPDLDGDGRAEWLVSATEEATQGAVYVFPGDLTGGRGTSYAFTRVPQAAHPVSPGDLDGDGLGDILLTGDASARNRLALLSGDLARDGGDLSIDDLETLGTFDSPRRPVLVDLDDDGVSELFIHGRGDVDSHVWGFAGDTVARAARGETDLDPDDPLVRIHGRDRDYFGYHVVPATDDTCSTGLAISAHFDETVYLFANADLRAGGVLDTLSVARTLGSGGEWYSAVLAGGQDLDGDGTLDVVTGDLDALAHQLWLAPWDLSTAQ